jgi:glutaredoxin 3
MTIKTVVYTKVGCPYCIRALKLLEQEQVGFEEISLSSQPDRRTEMIEKSAGKKTVPQIFLQGKHVGGCDDLFALYRREGKLI